MVFVSNFVPLRTESSVTIFTWERDHWPDCSLPLWISFFSTRSPLSPPYPFSSLPKSVNLFVCSGLLRTLRELITGWICLSPFDSPLYPPWPPLSLSSLFSSLCNSVNISEGSRLWRADSEGITGQLALSSFDSPSSPPVHLYPILPLLSSVLLCEHL